MAAPHQLPFPVCLFQKGQRFLPFFPLNRGLQTWAGPTDSAALLFHARTVICTCTTAGARLMGGVCYEHPARPHASSEIRSDVAHRGTLTHGAYVSAGGPGENTHSSQTCVDKQECTKRAHTRTHWTLSLPKLCNRAAPPHNHLFIKSKNVSAFHLQNTHGSPREGAIGFRHLKLEPGPKNTPEEGEQ